MMCPSHPGPSRFARGAGKLCRPSHICIFNMSDFGSFASSGRNLLPSSQAWRLAPRLSSGRSDDGRRYPPGIAIDWRRRRVVGQGCVWFAARSYAAIGSRDSCCSWTRREEFTGHARRKRCGSAIHQGKGPPEHHQRSAEDHSSPVNGLSGKLCIPGRIEAASGSSLMPFDVLRIARCSPPHKVLR